MKQMNLQQLNQLTENAKEYKLIAKDSVKRNKHMNQGIDDFDIIHQAVIDAILVDFINHIGVKSGIDYALYISDLNKA